MDNSVDEIVDALKDIKAALLLVVATNLQIIDRLPKIPGEDAMNFKDTLTDVAVLFRDERSSLREEK